MGIINYAEFIAEHLDKNIAYTEYIAENLDNNIAYTEYLAEKLDNVIDYSKNFRGVAGLSGSAGIAGIAGISGLSGSSGQRGITGHSWISDNEKTSLPIMLEDFEIIKPNNSKENLDDYLKDYFPSFHMLNE